MAQLGPGRRASRSNPCRKCGPKGINECFNFDDGGCLCYHIESDRLTDGGYLHLADGDDWRDRLPILPPAPPKPKADPDFLDRAYRALFDASPLSVDHHTQLLGRVWSNDLIDRTMLGTLPKGDRSRIAAAVLTSCPEALGVVPGLYCDRSVPSVYGVPGMLIGIPDEQGRVVGVQIRADDPGENGRYRWLSSPDKDAGAGASTAVCVARPITRSSSTRVFLTEGPLKAIYSADRMGVTVLAVPGVNAISGVVDAVRAVGATEVVLAFDRDAATNPKVARAEARMIDTLQGAGLTVLRVSWPDEYKGLDDALAANVLPVIEREIPIAADELLQRVEAAERRADEAEKQLAYTQELQRKMMQVFRNKNLGAERFTAVALSYFMASKQSVDPDGDEHVIPFKRLAEQTGMSADTTSKHVKERLQPLGYFDVRQQWTPERVDPDTGELFPGQTQTIIRPKVDPLVMLERLATAENATGHGKAKHGGRADRGRLHPCPDHPTAIVVKRTTYHCGECDRVLGKEPVKLLPSVEAAEAELPRDEPAWIDAPPSSDAADQPRELPTLELAPVGGDDHAGDVVGGDAPPDGSIGAAWLAGRAIPGAADRARAALAEADRATERDERRRANAFLAEELTTISEARGRPTFPKPNGSAPLDRWTDSAGGRT